MAKKTKRKVKDKKIVAKPLEFKIISRNHNQLWLWKTLESV